MTTKTKVSAKKAATSKTSAETGKKAAPANAKTTPRKIATKTAQATEPKAQGGNGGQTPEIPHEEIAERAYRIFLTHRQPGSQEHDWFLAEEQLRQERGA
jgi:hypothetical protein